MASPIKVKLVGDTTGFSNSLTSLRGLISGAFPSGGAGMFAPIAAGMAVAGSAAIGTLLQIGQALTDLGIRGVTDFADFDQGVRRIANLYPDLVEELGVEETISRIGATIKETSAEFGFTTDDVAESLYNASSATGDLEASTEILRLGSQAARIEGTALSTTVGTITARTNAFGLSIDETRIATDSLSASIRVGVIDAEKWGSNIGNIVGPANELGLSVQEMDAAVAQVTSAGQKAQKGTTGLATAFVEMLDPTTEVNTLFTEFTGKTIPDYMDAGGNFTGVLAQLDFIAGKTGKSMTEIFGTKEAGVTFLNLTGEKFDAFREKLDATTNSVGALEDGWAIAGESPKVTLDQFNATLHELSLTIGESLTPFLQEVTPLVTDFVKGLGPDASTLFADIGEALIAAAPALVAMAQAFIDLWPAIQPLLPVLVLAVQAFAWLVQPLNLLKVLLAGVTALLATGIASFVAVGLAVKTLAEWVLNLVGVDVSGWLNGMLGGLASVGNWFKNLGSAVWGWVTSAASFFVNAGGAIKDWFLEKLDFIAGWFRSFPGLLWGWISGGVSFFGEAASSIAGFFTEGFGAIADWFRELPGNVWEWISGATSDLFEAGKNIASEIGDGLWEGIKTALNGVIRLWNAIDIPFRISIPQKKVLGVTVFPGFEFGIADLLPDIPLLAKGGIVSSPTLAMIGEAGPEAVVPLSEFGGSGVTNLNVSVSVDGFVGSEDDLAEKVVDALSHWTRTNGVLPVASLVRR